MVLFPPDGSIPKATLAVAPIVQRKHFKEKSRQHTARTVDGPAKSESPVENGGKHPIIYRAFNHPLGDVGFHGYRNHPQ